RVGANSADAIIGGDLVVTASSKVLETVKRDETAMVYSTYELTTGDFTRKPDLQVPGAALRGAIADRIRRGPSHAIDAHAIAERLFGDSIYSNMVLLGLAYQLGHVPIPAAAIEEAIGLNGAAVETNRQAFRFGRLAAHDRDALDRATGNVTRQDARHDAGPVASLDDILQFRTRHLAAYQDDALARTYATRVRAIAELEARVTPGQSGLAEAVARGYHKLLAIKDEYEVARLYTDGAFAEQLAGQFDGVRSLEFHMAPPFLAWQYKDKATGQPRKVALPGWLMMPLLRAMAPMKRLRGTALDIFGLTKERRRERAMISSYERLLDEIERRLGPSNHATATAL
ncbi:unnamed protein product, partial [Phaeothamnion confervicola]